MSNLPDNIVSYDYARIQLMTQLNNVAESMRKCADFADHFSQAVAHMGPNGVFPPLPPFNGQMIDMSKMIQQPMPPHPESTPAPPANGKRKAAALVDGEAKKRKVKKPRDPDMPKRPASSYLLFQNEVRQAMKKANPGMANHEILSTISQKWASMTSEEKDIYNKRQESAKAQYKIDKEAYDQKATDVISPPALAVPSSPVVAPAPPAAAIKPVKTASVAPAPAVAESSSEADSEESSDSGDSSDDDEDEEEEEDEPVKKKSKKVAATKVQQPVPKKESRKKIKN